MSVNVRSEELASRIVQFLRVRWNVASTSSDDVDSVACFIDQAAAPALIDTLPLAD